MILCHKVITHNLDLKLKQTHIYFILVAHLQNIKQTRISSVSTVPMLKSRQSNPLSAFTIDSTSVHIHVRKVYHTHKNTISFVGLNINSSAALRGVQGREHECAPVQGCSRSMTQVKLIIATDTYCSSNCFNK